MAHKLIKVDGHPDLCRDVSSQAIINTDAQALAIAKQRKREILENRETIETLKNQVSSMQDDISGIKEMLKMLLERT